VELYIIRHGQSTNNLSMLYNPYDRQSDPPLTELGGQQAEAVARFVAGSHNIDTWVEQTPDSREVVQGFGFTHLYCSPMRRALQTCLPISHAVGLQPEIWVDIHEHGGMFLSYEDERGVVSFPGMTRAEIQAAFPHYIIPPAITEQGWWKPDAGMEDIAACQARAIRVATALRLQSSSTQRIALVTHGTFADNLIKALLNLLPGNDLRFFHYNTAISRIDFRQDGRTVVRYLNRVDHLAPELVS
jgi:broad specificity phosphatase PhoE